MRAGVAAAALAGVAWAEPVAHAQEPPRLCTETLIAMSDGVRLHAWVSRPAPDGPRPVLFMLDSYARGGQPGKSPSNDNLCPQVVPDDYVPQYLDKALVDRFTLVQVSYRGTGASEGLFDMTGPRTQRDENEAIDWAARQLWSTGRVFLAGESGTGFAAHHGLTNPHVSGALILTSCADMYRCFRRGSGYNALAEVYLAATLGGYNAGRDARQRLGTGANPDAPQQLAAIASTSLMTKTDDVDDGWWQQRSALASLPRVRVPVLYTTDNYDIVQPFDAFQQTPGAHLVLGMGHQARDSTVVAGGARWYDLVRPAVDRFVAHYGLGIANGAERDPRITVLTNTGSWGQFRAGRMLLSHADAWPLPGTRFTDLYLDSGTLGEAPPAAGAAPDSTLALPAPALDLRTAAFVEGANLASDLSGDERRGLTYTTPPLRQDLQVTGPIALRLWAATTALDLAWTVRLTDVWPDGRSEWITDGDLRATLRKVDPVRSLRDAAGEIVRPWLTYDTSEPVPPGEPVRYDIDLVGTSNVFRAGHRIRLDVLPADGGESDAPRTLGVGAVTIRHDAAHPSALSLPVIPAGCDASVPLADDTPATGPCAASLADALHGAPPVVTAGCPGTRVVVLWLRNLHGHRLQSATIVLGGRVVRRIRATALRRPVRLRGLPPGAFTLRIFGRAAHGGVVRAARRYPACAGAAR